MSKVKEKALNEDLFTGPEDKVPSPDDIKGILAARELILSEKHAKQGSGLSVLREYTLFIDRLLTELFIQTFR